MTKLEQVFSPDSFRNQAHQLVDTLANYLENIQQPTTQQAIPYQSPADSLAMWQADFDAGPNDNPLDFFKKVIEHSTHLHHPKYMGHQVCVVSPMAAVASLLDSFLNNGMAIYEMGMVANPLEKIITDLMAKRIGFGQEAGGILTSGGTLGNLTALLAARAKVANTDVWHQGHGQKLAIMVSEEAHYCVDRAARIMGLGSRGIIKIPTDNYFRMQTELLEQYHQEATQNGYQVIAIIGSSCSTSTGAYDDLAAIGAFAQQKNIWFHVDGAHGGAVIFSEKYKPKIKGIELANSVVIDWHKMLLTPALVTALIFKDNQDSYQTFQQKAQYLFADQNSQEWYNAGKRTFECTKLMMCLRVYTILKTYGEDILGQNVDQIYDMGHTFAQMIAAHPAFELGVQPETNIVCFRLKAAENAVIEAIRHQLLQDGKFYIVQTVLRKQTFFRVSIMNPLTTAQDLAELLAEIERVGSLLGML